MKSFGFQLKCIFSTEGEERARKKTCHKERTHGGDGADKNRKKEIKKGQNKQGWGTMPLNWGEASQIETKKERTDGGTTQHPDSTDSRFHNVKFPSPVVRLRLYVPNETKRDTEPVTTPANNGPSHPNTARPLRNGVSDSTHDDQCP